MRLTLGPFQPQLLRGFIGPDGDTAGFTSEHRSHATGLYDVSRVPDQEAKEYTGGRITQCTMIVQETSWIYLEVIGSIRSHKASDAK